MLPSNPLRRVAHAWGLARSPQACHEGRAFFVPDGRVTVNGHTLGLWKLIADAHTGTILGGQILETNADASIHLVKMAIDAGLTVGDLSTMVAYHPTRAEGLKGLAHTICTHLRMPSASTFCPQ